MKSLIVSSVVIVGLIVFFYVIDRKEIIRYDDNQSVLNEAPIHTVGKIVPAIPMPAPIDNRKSKEKAVAAVMLESESRDGETNHAADSRSIVKMEPETKSMLAVEAKPVMETNIAAIVAKNNKPAAVPAITPEEAEKTNAEASMYALTEKEKREPFYSLYQNDKLETVCFEGTIRATSTIPDPEKNDYDNCLYALFVEIDSVLSNMTSDIKISCEVIINVPIMKDKTILQENVFLPGDKIWCVCAEYDLMPQRIQEIQLSDDIQSYEHQLYYTIGIKKISSFQKGGNRNFAKREITILPIQSLPKDEKAAKLRKERILAEIDRIEADLDKHGGTFEKWKEEYKPIEEKYKQLCKDGYKGWIHDSYFAASGRESIYDTQAYISGILPYKKFLEKNNIDLIIVRVPSKADFAARVLTADDFHENPAWVEYYYECLKNDIEIVDPMPEMWKCRFDFPLFYFYNTPTESHPFEGQAFISAKMLSEVLKRYSFAVSKDPIKIEDFVLKTPQPRFFWPPGNPKFKPEENIMFRHVIQGNKSLSSLSVNTGSPFIFLSNSYFWYPQSSQGASVPAYTAYFIQHIPDWFYQDGIGNPMLRNLISDHQALSNRKAVIMVGHPSDWNGSFPPFPKYLSDGAKKLSLDATLDFQSPNIRNLDNGSFLFSTDADGVTQFTQNQEKETANKTFKIELSIPGNQERSTCMLRVNFGTNSYITISVRDEQKEIDTTTLSFGTNQHTDFFIPVSGESHRISIEFCPSFPNQKYSIKNIELWYY